MARKNCLVAQSGGPTAAINASLAGVIEEVLKSPETERIYGALNGIQGVIRDDLMDLTAVFAGCPERLEQLKVTPAMYLGSCRYRLDKDLSHPDYERIFRIFEKYDIGYVFYIGGNDSMDTVLKLSEYAARYEIPVKVMGIPKTIDNDLDGMDHTPGFGSAAKYIATSMREISYDTAIYNTRSIVVVEIMGRNAGWLTASAALARNSTNTAPQLIYLPEVDFSIDQFVKDVAYYAERDEHVLIAVSEGIHDKEGNYISAQSAQVDQFGHVMLSGAGKFLEGVIANRFGCKVRSVELNVLQRSAGHSTSAADLEEAAALGRYGVAAALAGKTGEMAVLTRTSNTPYTVSYGTYPIEQVANREKKVPRAWINAAGNDVTEEMLAYLTPLVAGTVQVPEQNGLPDYLPVSHLYPANRK